MPASQPVLVSGSATASLAALLRNEARLPLALAVQHAHTLSIGRGASGPATSCNCCHLHRSRAPIECPAALEASPESMLSHAARNLSPGRRASWHLWCSCRQGPHEVACLEAQQPHETRLPFVSGMMHMVQTAWALIMNPSTRQIPNESTCRGRKTMSFQPPLAASAGRSLPGKRPRVHHMRCCYRGLPSTTCAGECVADQSPVIW